MRIRAGGVLALAAVACFAAGLAGLFRDRFESGDIYPRYSTLRSDPLGTRALYSALERDTALRVERRYVAEKDTGAPAAYFFLGLPGAAFAATPALSEEHDSLARGGHRVIAAFIPVLPFAPADSAEAGKAPFPPGAGSRWGFRMALDSDTAAIGKDKRAFAKAAAGRDSLPWISTAFFDSLDGAWRVLYRRGPHPVAIERPVGKGSVVLLSDTYALSNQALFHAGPGRLLARLLGGHDRIVFDETHFGIRHDPGLADLLARHRLHLLAPSLLLLFAAYLWKSRSEAVLPAAPGPEAGPHRAPQAREGLLALLMRGVPRERVLDACLEQWRESEAGRGGRREAAAAAAARERESQKSRKGSLAADFAALQSILNRKKTP